MSSTVNVVAHGFVAGSRFYFGNVLPEDTGIVEGQVYYVLAAGLTANAFKFAETDGGTAITLAANVTECVVSGAAVYTAITDPTDTMAPPVAPSAPGSCVLTSTAGLAPDGSVITRLNITITQPTSATLRHTIVTVSGGSNVVKVVIPVGQTTGSIASVIPGVSFTGSAVAYDTFGLASSATVSSAHVAAGDVTAPSVPTGLAASGAILGIVASWTAVSDTDLSHYELAISTDGGSSFPTILKTKSTLISVGELSSGVKTVKVRAVDLTGNASAYTSTVAATSRITDLVTNSTAKVVIDSSGLTIIDGVLTMQDEFGKSVLGASGFTGSWFDFVRLGLYNARFLAGSGLTGLATGRTAAMPYWNLTKDTGAPTFDHVANTGLKANFTVLSQKVSVLSDKVPILPGRKYQIACTFDYSSTTLVTVTATIFWYKADGTASTTASTATQYLAAAVSLSGTSTGVSFDFDTAGAPSDAAFAAAKVTLEETLHGSTCSVTMRAIGLREGLTSNVVGTNTYFDLPGGIQDTGGNDVYPTREWVPFAYPPGLTNASDLSGSVLNLATVAAGNGGAFVAVVYVPGLMSIDSVSLWNTDTSLLRSAEVGVYYMAGASLTNLIRVTSGSTSFTPSAASKREVTVTTVAIRPGTYFVVVRNTSTARTFGIGGTANSATVYPTLGMSNASIAALGAALDISGWSASGAARGIGLKGSSW